MLEDLERLLDMHNFGRNTDYGYQEIRDMSAMNKALRRYVSDHGVISNREVQRMIEKISQQPDRDVFIRPSMRKAQDTMFSQYTNPKVNILLTPEGDSPFNYVRIKEGIRIVANIPEDHEIAIHDREGERKRTKKNIILFYRGEQDLREYLDSRFKVEKVVTHVGFYENGIPEKPDD